MNLRFGLQFFTLGILIFKNAKLVHFWFFVCLLVCLLTKCFKQIVWSHHGISMHARSLRFLPEQWIRLHPLSPPLQLLPHPTPPSTKGTVNLGGISVFVKRRATVAEMLGSETREVWKGRRDDHTMTWKKKEASTASAATDSWRTHFTHTCIKINTGYLMATLHDSSAFSRRELLRENSHPVVFEDGRGRRADT